MKKILITGEGSYIGERLKEWLTKDSNSYFIDELSVRTDDWKNKSFKEYDVIFHVAAIVHQQEKDDMKDIYFKVNRELPVEIAKKAKQEGVKQFIFMSTMAVFGKEGRLDKVEVIDKSTPLNPQTWYGKSKLEAEELLKKLSNQNFTISILRPPMVYGPKCPGNYLRLSNLAKKMPIFPKIKNNKRSMIFIYNLCEFIKEIVLNAKESAVYHPQNEEYVNTSLMMKEIYKVNKKKSYLSSLFGKIILVLGKDVSVLQKVFGSLVYSKELSIFNYEEICFAETIEQSEKGEFAK